MSITQTDTERVRLAHEAALAYEDRGDLDPITNCDACGRAFFTWQTDDDTPLVWTNDGIFCETCAHNPDVDGAVCSDHPDIRLADGCYKCDPDDYLVIDGHHINRLAVAPGTWADPIIEEFPNTAYQPWGDDIVSGWQATYETVTPDGHRVLFVESAYVTTHEVDGETRYGTNESSETIILNANGNEAFTEYTAGDPPTIGLVAERTAHAACERFIRGDLRNYDGFLSSVYSWALDNIED